MAEPTKLKVISSLVFMVLLLAYVLYSSSTGLFSEDVAIKVRAMEPRNMVFTGYPQILLCLSGIIFSSVPLVIMGIAGYLKFKRIDLALSWQQKKTLEKVLTPVITAPIILLVTAYIWNGLLLPEYR